MMSILPVRVIYMYLDTCELHFRTRHITLEKYITSMHAQGIPIFYEHRLLVIRVLNKYILSNLYGSRENKMPFSYLMPNLEFLRWFLR